MCKILRENAKVLILTGNLKFHAHRARVQGFKENAAVYRNSLEVVKVIEGYDSYSETYSQLNQALKEHPNIEGIYGDRSYRSLSGSNEAPWKAEKNTRHL
jgi:LacI family transcriptional regulator